MFRRDGLLSLWAPPLVWMALIFYASSIPSLRSPFEWDYLYRKLAHVAEYAVLAVLYCRATRGRLGLSLAAAVLYAASDEYHQGFVPGRVCSPVDVLIDSSGAALGAFLYRWRIGRISESEAG